MKTKTLTTLTVLFLITCGQIRSQTNKNKDYQLVIEKGKIVKIETQTFWEIPATLINKTKDTLKYFSMSCSWQDFYSVDNKKLQVEPVECDRNFPITLTLAPNQSRKAIVRLLISQTMDASEISFKIGFNLIQIKSSTDKYDFNEQRKMKNMIWSNVISM